MLVQCTQLSPVQDEDKELCSENSLNVFNCLMRNEEFFLWFKGILEELKMHFQMHQ